MKLQPFACTLFICLLLSSRGLAQAGGHGNPSSQNAQMPTDVPRVEVAPGETPPPLSAEMIKRANLQRQAAIKNDTDKLLKLATELKASVDKSTANILSVDVIRKAEEIEKLAHSVKDKMKGPG